MNLTFRLFFAAFLCSISAAAQCPLGLSGTFKIGPSGVYSTLTAALTDVHTKGIAGPLTLELQASYTSTAETFPITLPPIPCASQAKHVTIRPESGAPTLVITTNDSIATLDLNNGSFYTLDGRPGGTDTAHRLTIGNTHLYGTAIRFINGASYNELNHLIAQGVNTISNAGVITFEGTNVATGNAYNRLDTCTVTAGATPPIYGILADDYNAALNKGNVINGCNVSNVAGTLLYGACGIYVKIGYDSTTVTGNSVYQTAAYNVPYNAYTQPWNYTGIQVGSPYDGGQLVANNYVGGSQPLAGGPPMTLDNCQEFVGISASSASGPTLASQVTGNTITNLSFGGVNARGCKMIDLGQLNAGGFNGACTKNTIGNMGAGYSLQYHFEGQGINLGNELTLSGIFLETTFYTDPIVISGNQIGGWLVDANNPWATFRAIDATIATVPYNKLSIDNNQIGDDSTTNSILLQDEAYLVGIFATDPSCECTPARDTIAITNNHIANLTATQSVLGIQYTTFTVAYTGQTAEGRIVSNNTLHSLNLIASQEPVDQEAPAVTGIYIYNYNDYQGPNGTGNFICSGNSISALGDASAFNNLAVTGIYLNSSGYAPAMHYSISGNHINSLYGASPGTITGINVLAQDVGASTVDNNMIDLGLTSKGHPIDLAPGYGLYGMYNSLGSFSYLHNSVYMHVGQGAVHYSGLIGACFASANTDTSTAPCILMNNIFSSYAPAANKNFYLLGMPVNAQSDYNIFNIQGSSYLGYPHYPVQPANDSTLAQWQALSGQDQHSQFADPLFNNPEASSAYIDLHLQNGTPAESSGTAAYTTITDIDGKIRTQYTPVDIGADAGNLKGIPTPPPSDTTKSDTTGTTTAPPTTPTDSAIVVPYPNPFFSTLTLALNAEAPGTAHVLIYSLTGKLVTAIHPTVITGTNTITIPTTAFPDGIYVLHVFIGSARQTFEIQKKSD